MKLVFVRARFSDGSWVGSSKSIADVRLTECKIKYSTEYGCFHWNIPTLALDIRTSLYDHVSVNREGEG